MLSRHTLRAEFTVYTLLSTSRTIQNIVQQRSLVLGHLYYSFKKRYISTPCEIACCISHTALLVWILQKCFYWFYLYVYARYFCGLFLGPSIFFHLYYPFIAKDQTLHNFCVCAWEKIVMSQIKIPNAIRIFFVKPRSNQSCNRRYCVL